MAAPFSNLTFSTTFGIVRIVSRCHKLRLIRHQHSATNTQPQTEHQDSIVTQGDGLPQYPAIKPKYPPGIWGKMDHKYAWFWKTTQEDHLSIPDIQGRINALTRKETSAIVLEPINQHPSALLFRQYVTKTTMLGWEDVPFNKVEDDSDLSHIVDQVKQDISDFMQMEHEFLQRSGNSHQSEHCNTFIRLLTQSLITRLGNQFQHLQTCQYDENVIVRSLWDRFGIDRRRRKYCSDPDVYLYDDLQDHRIVSEGTFQAMLRSHLPLPVFAPRDDGISVSSPAPEMNFKISAYGHEKTQKKKQDIIAGHRPGDPCEYGLVGFISTHETHSIEERISAQTARDCRLAMGLTMTFSWLAAQAANQGFSYLNDLTYPLTSQTVLTDGRKFSFLAYQLNTLELWKDNEGNPLVNLCWHSKEMPLYHSVENGKINELDEDVLKTLVKIFTLVPKDRGYNMKPTVENLTESAHKVDFVPYRVDEEIVVEEEQYIVS